MSTIPSDPSVHCFQLEVAPPAEAGPTAPVAPLTALCLDFGLPRKNQKQGSFDYDRENREKGGFVHEWASLAEFDAWHRQEEITNSIELTVSKSRSGKEYKQKRVYKCSRKPSGGKKPYKKKHPEWKRKRDSKKTGCRCKLTIKIYHDTPIVLGRYDADHDHDIGVNNVAHTRMSLAARNEICKMLTQQIDNKEIVCKAILIFFNTVTNLINQSIRCVEFTLGRLMVAAIALSPHKISLDWEDYLQMIRSDCTLKMQSPHRFGLISSDLKMRGSFTKTNSISPLKIHHYSRMTSLCASKPPSNWTRSGVLAIALSGLTRRIILLFTREFNYSRS